MTRAMAPRWPHGGLLRSAPAPTAAVSAGAVRATCALMRIEPAPADRTDGPEVQRRTEPAVVPEIPSRKPRTAADADAADADADAGAGSAAAASAPAGGEVERRALAGDRDAWSALIARHNRKVVVALLARGVAIEQAKDLAQETWLRLIESQRAGRLSSLSLPGLAIVQAGYLLRNAQRAEGARGTAALRDADADADCDGAASPDPEPLAEERVLQRDRVQRVAGALATCPPSARRVFEFVYDHPELSYPEVAARFGLSTQRVKQTVCEVRKRLRAALGEMDRDRDEEA